MTDTLPDLSDALETALRAADAASGPILEIFRSEDLGLEGKGDGSPVTRADRAAERVVREVLESAWPDIDILGEEEGFEDRGSRCRWIIDPIDGTLSFASGIPLFGTLIALEDRRDEHSLLGVIKLHGLGETYAGARGLGVRCGSESLRIPSGEGVCLGWEDDASQFESAMISMGDPLQFMSAGVGDDVLKLARLPLLRGYTDCFGHAQVLRGAVGAMVDPGLALWDLAATRCLVEEAGGRIYVKDSQQDGKFDAILGQPHLVEGLVDGLGW